nr:ATP-binding protein [uncultured Fluviicola sp.]
MNIAITGAHLVGKTTLAEKLHASLRDYIYVREPYVELEEKGYSFSGTPILEDFSIQLDHAIENCSIDEPDMIFDRCPLDLFAYMYVIGGAKASQNFYTKVMEAMADIDLLVFVPIENPDLIGCPESEFPELRKKVNDLLEEWIDDFEIEIIQVSGTLAERENQVLRRFLELEGGLD